MRQYLWIVFLALLLCGQAQARDSFDGVQCGGDVAKALVGHTLPNGPADETDARHKDLQLKDLGGDEITDNLNSVSYSICGSEYTLLVDHKDRIRDVLAIPAHSITRPEFGDGYCKLGGNDTPYVVVAILRNDSGKRPKTMGADAQLPAVTAWKLDEKAAKFVSIPATGLTCAASGVVTADGGP
jgi:hypothetical protein